MEARLRDAELFCGQQLARPEIAEAMRLSQARFGLPRSMAPLEAHPAPRAMGTPPSQTAAPGPHSPSSRGPGGRRQVISDQAFASTAPSVYRAYLDTHDTTPSNAELAARLSEGFGIRPAADVRTIERRIRTYREQGGTWPPACHR
jgi:hypothetical protein